ncbi:hypothetical protein pb186bvf_008326 [Paramecium bursaria]
MGVKTLNILRNDIPPQPYFKKDTSEKHCKNKQPQIIFLCIPKDYLLLKKFILSQIKIIYNKNYQIKQKNYSFSTKMLSLIQSNYQYFTYESEKFIRIPKISSPIILNIIQQIQKKVKQLNSFSIEFNHQICNHILASLNYFKSQLPNKPFEDDHTVQQLESFYEISYKHVVKKQTITDVEKQQYLRVYPFVSRIVGEIQEKLTVNLIKQVREKGIHKMQKFDYIQDINQFIT